MTLHVTCRNNALSFPEAKNKDVKAEIVVVLQLFELLPHFHLEAGRHTQLPDAFRACQVVAIKVTFLSFF